MYYPIDRSALKKRAKELLREGNVSPIKMSVLLYAVVFVLSAALIAVSYATAVSRSGPGLIHFFSILIYLASIVLSQGYTIFCLGIWKGEKMPYGSLFDGFSFAGKIIGLTLVMALFVWLWSLLFIIPGIIAMYRYSFALYNLCENPELGIMEALEMSKQQTQGYKMELFLLQLSFFGWSLLASLPQTFAGMAVANNDPGGPSIVISLVLLLASMIGQVFLQPYMQLSHAGFYLQATAANVNEEDPVSPPPPPEF